MHPRFKRLSGAVVAALSFALIAPPKASAQVIASVGYALDNGDVNGDLIRDLSDPIYVLSHLFAGTAAPVPLALCGGDPTSVMNGDSNGDGALDVSDPVHLLAWLFSGGPAPASACGDGAGGARNVNPRVIPTNANPHGKSYGEWAATWWQWAFSLPTGSHPLFDTADCSEGQTGHVWFLGGSFATSTTERTCTVPTGTALFFPVLNTECSSLEPDPFFCDDTASCLTCNDQFYTGGNELSLVVDGVEITNLESYRVQSGVFPIGPVPDDNIFGVPGGTSGISLADGHYVMLAPLSKGQHRIDFRACFEFFGGCSGFELVVGYDITVK